MDNADRGSRRVLTDTTIVRLVMLTGLTSFLLLFQMAGGANELPRLLVTDVGFVAGSLGLMELARLTARKSRHGWPAIGVGVVAVALGLYALHRGTLATWVLLLGVYGALAWLDRAVGGALLPNHPGRWAARWALAMVGGFLPVALSQIESRFAEEEFFALVQGIELTGFCLLFLTGQAHLDRVYRARGIEDERARRGGLLIAGGFASLVVGFGIWGGVAYQSSFYAADVPGYPGITETAPFLCGQATPDPRRPAGEEVHRRLLMYLEDQPRKSVPELGMLALGTDDRSWAGAFRDAILTEALEGRFTGPANSVKSTQYQAALRAYYAPRIRAAFPGLFSTGDWETLRDWFAAINRRAWTVEWVDGMYALAFARWPQGPYANQETGAGLLAILETEGLGAPELPSRNRAYLRSDRRGWATGFRNTDDAFVYQTEWITNAYFQSLYWRSVATQPTVSHPSLIEANQQLAFEWMLVQAIPDGAPLRYNHPRRQLPIGTAYLAALLERDPRFIWWAARMLDWKAGNSVPLNAQPGAEKPTALRGNSPTTGSCLMFGNSGLPDQPGPLAPDKLVFRDGWQPDAMYMLLNLRFSGWHRYKATNSAILLYQEGPIVVEKVNAAPFGWLPQGRSLFRDKRVPRENLNGLLIPRTGWSQVVHRLTGIGGPWAQDPPPYARVEFVDWLGPVDVARTTIEGWRGWSHARTVYFVHRGPIVVIDAARGKGQAAVVWHLVGEGRRDGSGLWLRSMPSPVRVLLPSQAWRNIEVRQTGAKPGEGDIGVPNWDLVYRSPVPGQLDLVTVFALRSWASMQHEVYELGGGRFVKLEGEDQQLWLLQNDSEGWLQAQGLATDGRWALVWKGADRDYRVCFAGGTSMQVTLESQPVALRTTEGQLWPDWEWDAGTLIVRGALPEAGVCLEVQG